MKKIIVTLALLCLVLVGVYFAFPGIQSLFSQGVIAPATNNSSVLPFSSNPLVKADYWADDLVNPKSKQQLAYEANLGRELTVYDTVGFSNQGKLISNQFANRLVALNFREDLFLGLNGRFNGANKVMAAAVTENSTAWWKAYELMLGKTKKTLEADATAEAVKNSNLPWLAIHVNACMRADDEIRRHLEELDGVPEGTYQDLPVFRYQTHWVTRIIEVNQEEYNMADSFAGWHMEAEDGIYRAKYGKSPDGFFFVLEIFQDDSKWAAVVVHSYDDPTGSGFSLGGVRNDDLSIVVPHDPCTGDGYGPVILTDDPEPTPVPTLEPKPSDPGQYVHPTGKPTAPPPAEPASTEPPAKPAAAKPTAKPTKAPTAAPVATQKPTQVPVVAQPEVVNDPPANNTYPAEPPSAEPGLGPINNEAIADPFGG